MDKEFIEEVKKKREFSQLPDSIVEKVASETGDVKEARALLRKYFGVFLTNKVIKGKGTAEEILKAHISSKKRNYNEFYREIFNGEGWFKDVIDLGAGVNGYSYVFLRELLGDLNYSGLEASGQVVTNMNSFFEENHFPARAFHGDLMNFEVLDNIFEKTEGKKVIFLFQIIDALEKIEKDFSKKLLNYLFDKISAEDLIVVTLPIESLSGRANFAVRRKWLVDFLEENFKIEKDFLQNGERILCIRKG